VATIAMVLLTQACSTPQCPEQIEDLHDPAMRGRIGSGFVAGTGIVQRYVDSPDARYRGYDLQITSRIAGLAEADQIMFLAAQEPIPDIEPGADVLIVGVRGPRVAEYHPAGCPALIPYDP
jgi:hypothetical protein